MNFFNSHLVNTVKFSLYLALIGTKFVCLQVVQFGSRTAGRTTKGSLKIDLQLARALMMK